MKKILILLILVIATGCTSESSIKFKEDYERLNGNKNKMGMEYRNIEISKKNVFKEVEAKEIVKKINNKETFYVYFGSELCPWCRSVIEMADSVSRNKKIDKIYYVDVWDDDGNEIFRDKYELKDNELVLTYKGVKEYKKIIDSIDSELLRDYVITDSEGNSKEVGEKRIYAPNFIYFKKGKGVRLITGKSGKQTDSREKLTKEMLKDEKETFTKFFTN